MKPKGMFWLFLYPAAPVLLGAWLALAPRVLFAVLLLGLAVWCYRKVQGRAVPALGLALPAGRFPAPIAAIVVALLMFQSVAGFCAGVGFVAGLHVAGLLAVALVPSFLVAGIVVLHGRRA